MKRKSQFKIWTVSMIAALLMVSCDQIGEEENDERVRYVPVETVVVEVGSFDDQIRVSGVVEALEDATVSAENSGRIRSIVERGERVAQGDVIAQMDDRLSRSQFEAARTQFELAEDTYERLRALYEDEIISTQDYRSARAQKDQARSQLEQAEKQLRDTHIEAPFSGRVEERLVSSGELVSPGTPVVRLINSQRVRVLAGIPERYSGQVDEGSPVVLQFRSLNGERIESNISFAGHLIDASTRTFPVEVELENSDNRYRPEMIVDLRVQRTTIENAIVIPRTAIVRDEGREYVFIAVEDSDEKEAELVEVRTGFASGALIQIVEGLNDGDEVVTAGMSTLSSGDRLNITDSISSSEKASRLQEQERWRSQ